MQKNGLMDVIPWVIATIENLSEPWGIKDTESRHIYMNRAAQAYTSTPAGFDLEGKYDADFPTTWAEHAQDFMHQDRLAESSSQTVAIIETDYWYGKRYLDPYISEKIPLRDREGECVGTLWNARKVKVISPLVCIGEKSPSVLQTSFETSVFSEAEMDVLYLLLKRLSRKEIAIQLNLSVKTVDNRIQNMYTKGGVHSLKQFEEYCRSAGLINVLPRRFMKKGVIFI